jgi:micrococcal nuclease
MNSRILVVALISIASIIALALITVSIAPQSIQQVFDSIDRVITPRTVYGETKQDYIERVVDGDTIKLKSGETVRLLNIDTPETVKENTPVMCYGHEASDFAKQIMTGQSVILRFDKEQRDKYGRVLAFVFATTADNTLVENSYNAQLVKLGYARSYIIKPNNTQERYFRKVEREARDAKLGVWNCPKPFVE